MTDSNQKFMDNYTAEQIAMSELELTDEEEKAIELLNARIRVMDPTWGDSLNDESAILRVVLASRKVGR
jgi:hypothetical protein